MSNSPVTASKQNSQLLKTFLSIRNSLCLGSIDSLCLSGLTENVNRPTFSLVPLIPGIVASGIVSLENRGTIFLSALATL
jgi:hypothetical protein